MTLLLASASQSRLAMLTAAGVAVEARASGVDEDALKEVLADRGPRDLADALAEAKALKVSTSVPDRLVLGGDSVASVDGRLFDKPVDRADAAAHLRAFSGRTLRLTSAAVLARDGCAVWRLVDTADLVVRPLGDEFIACYLDAEWPAVAACVGCFRIEGRGVQLFDRVEGDHHTVLGLPLLPVLAQLRRLGAMAS